MALLVCRTCPRDDRDPGSFGGAFDRAVDGPARERGVRVRHVPCLGGCPHSGNVGIDAPGKPRVRFSSVTPDDAEALAAAAAAYDASETGMPGDWEVPDGVADRVTAVSPKRVGAGRWPARSTG